MSFITLSREAEGHHKEEQFEDLLLAIAHRNQAALAALYDQTHRAVFGLLLRLIPGRMDAEELLLEVYEQVWRDAPRLLIEQDSANGCTPLSWVLSIARRVALDRLAAAHFIKPRQGAFTTLLDWSANEGTQRQGGRFAGERDRIKTAMQRLTNEQRRTLEFTYFSGLSYSETAAHLEMSPAKVRALLREGLCTLREHLDWQR